MQYDRNYVVYYLKCKKKESVYSRASEFISLSESVNISVSALMIDSVAE